MFRGIIPFLLASLGFILFGLVINMPLFEWQISEIVTDSSYEVRFTPSPWTAQFGDSLEDGSYIFYQFDGLYCRNGIDPEKLNSVVRRSWSEETVERITQNINRSIIPWLWLFLFLCGVYMWWYELHYERPMSDLFISTVVAMILLGILVNFGRVAFPKIGSLGCLEGTVTFSAELSKVHFETLLVLIAAILAEVGALLLMLRQVLKAAVQNGKASRSAVG